jgi:hypothetical protein
MEERESYYSFILSRTPDKTSRDGNTCSRVIQQFETSVLIDVCTSDVEGSTPQNPFGEVAPRLYEA